MPKKKLKIALVFGGTSAERQVSLMSAASVEQNLDYKKYDVVKVEVTPDPGWLTKSVARLLSCDVALLALHGPGGEDGTIQGVLELLGIKYTCSGVLASALAMDKQRTKKLVAASGVPVLPDILVSKNNFQKNRALIAGQLQGPVVVKPNRLGSSIGVKIVKDKVTAAIAEVLAECEEVIIEPFIQGREITVPVLGNLQPNALPVIEIVPRQQSSFYDYTAKYSAGGSEHLIPAPLTKPQTREVSEWAVIAHTVLGCRGVTRSDFILDTKGRFWFLETNTIPGMTATSLAPQAAQAAGYSFSQFLDKLIDLAQEKE